jgi:hypothetical protein
VALANLLFFRLLLDEFLIMCFGRKNGISFVSIDESIPLSEQGPFDVILHKVSHTLFYTIIERMQLHWTYIILCFVEESFFLVNFLILE